MAQFHSPFSSLSAHMAVASVYSLSLSLSLRMCVFKL